MILNYNTTSPNQITLDGEALQKVVSFTYLDNIIGEQVRIDVDVKELITKASAELPRLQNLLNS